MTLDSACNPGDAARLRTMSRVPLSCAWRQVLATALVGLTLLLSSTSVARAVDIPQLQSAVTDQTGALTGREPDIQATLQQLFDSTGVQLYVLFVPTTGDMSMGDYAAAVGDQNLGADDALLVVALQDRTDNLSVGSGLRGRVSQTSLDQIRSSDLEPGLAAGDYANAVIGSAQALGPVLTPVVPATAPAASPPPDQPGQPAPDAGSVLVFLAILVGFIVVVVGGAWLIGRIRNLARRAAGRLRGGPDAGADGPRSEQADDQDR